jgi:hypothetical protein
MEKVKKLFLGLTILAGLMVDQSLFSQDEKISKFTTGADFYSSYIWRGTKYGSGPSIQPMLKFSAGPFTAGVWGSFDFNGYQEADLYISFSLPAGFSLGMTDYYYPDYDYFDYSDTTGSHAFEINFGFSKGGLSLSGNYIINKAGNAGTMGGDKYFEAKYSFKSLFLLIGAGDGWHSTNKDNGSDRFVLCNLGLGVTREIKITEKFSIPVNGQLIFNPDRHKMYIIAGFTLQQ